MFLLTHSGLLPRPAGFSRVYESRTRIPQDDFRKNAVLAGYRAIKADLIDGQAKRRGWYAIKEEQPDNYLQEAGGKYKTSLPERRESIIIYKNINILWFLMPVPALIIDDCPSFQ